jgi:hypothetical protein
MSKKGDIDDDADDNDQVRQEVGKVSFKSNGNEALSDEPL